MGHTHLLHVMQMELRNANIQITTHNEKQFYGSVCTLVIERALKVHLILPLFIFSCLLMN